MKRSQLQSLLKSLIPSLSYNDIECKDLYREESRYDHPHIISKCYAEGIELEYDGETFISTYKDIRPGKGRHVSLNLQSFYCGGGHWYGTLVFRGPHFICGRRSISGSATRDYPQVSVISCNVLRILPKEDRDNHPNDWLDWEVNEPTTRFYNMKEVIFTAMYIALDRIEGPFYFTVGSACELAPIEFEVSKTGVVKFDKDSRIKKMLSNLL